MHLLIGEDAAAVDQHLKLSVGVTHLRFDAVLRFELALKAPGQASFVASNQAAANLDFVVLVHKLGGLECCEPDDTSTTSATLLTAVELLLFGNVYAGGGAGPVQLQRCGVPARLV